MVEMSSNPRIDEDFKYVIQNHARTEFGGQNQKARWRLKTYDMRLWHMAGLLIEAVSPLCLSQPPAGERELVPHQVLAVLLLSICLSKFVAII